MARLWAEWLRDQFTQRDWSDSDAAEACALPVEVISAWLDGERPTVEELRKLAAALRLPILSVMVGAEMLTEQEVKPDRELRTTAERAVAEGIVPPQYRIISFSQGVTEDTPPNDESEGV